MDPDRHAAITGDKIQQHENNALLYGPIFAKQEYSIINALRYTGDQVDRFRTKFLQTLHRLYNEVSSTITRYELVDLALKDINVGKNANFPFAFSNMAFSTNFTCSFIWRSRLLYFV